MYWILMRNRHKHTELDGLETKFLFSKIEKLGHESFWKFKKCTSSHQFWNPLSHLGDNGPQTITHRMCHTKFQLIIRTVCILSTPDSINDDIHNKSAFDVRNLLIFCIKLLKKKPFSIHQQQHNVLMLHTDTTTHFYAEKL
jgi:hypothetical protein